MGWPSRSSLPATSIQPTCASVRFGSKADPTGPRHCWSYRSALRLSRKDASRSIAEASQRRPPRRLKRPPKRRSTPDCQGRETHPEREGDDEQNYRAAANYPPTLTLTVAHYWLGSERRLRTAQTTVITAVDPKLKIASHIELPTDDPPSNPPLRNLNTM